MVMNIEGSKSLWVKCREDLSSPYFRSAMSARGEGVTGFSPLWSALSSSGPLIVS